MTDFKKLLHSNVKPVMEELQEVLRDKLAKSLTSFGKAYYTFNDKSFGEIGLSERQRVRILVCTCTGISERQFYRILTEQNQIENLSHSERYIISVIVNKPITELFPKHKSK